MKLKQLTELQSHLAAGDLASSVAMVDQAIKDNLYVQWKKQQPNQGPGATPEPLPGILESVNDQPLTSPQVWALSGQVNYQIISELIDRDVNQTTRKALARKMGISPSSVGNLQRNQATKISYKVLNCVYAHYGDQVFNEPAITKYRKGLDALKAIDQATSK